jgi:2-polyprenyl-6-hydroxyphenyl methylase/3-demethylubiquinone-9 3-methyltransferase
MEVRHYEYASADEVWADDYIVPSLVRTLTGDTRIQTVLDAGCGNGRLTGRLAALGLHMSGFDVSESGIAHASTAVPGVTFKVASGYQDLRELFGQVFDACVCVEVVEHLYDPRTFIHRVHDVLRPDGWLIVTTPYHGYLKNLALAVSGQLDRHFDPLWDGGHIKFWSRRSLTALLEECGFRIVRFEGAGRVPLLWKSMIITARRA